MKILIGCEESQVLCSTFRKANYEAYSCDILSTRGNPLWHYKADIMTIIPKESWTLIILHPDCTALALSGNKWYGKNCPKHKERLASIKWTLALWEMAKQYSKAVALENPQSVIFNYLYNVQYIQPYQFGHTENKMTGFALYNLPRLIPTNVVAGYNNNVHNMGPNKNRKRDRSITYQGIADAIVCQWGNHIKKL